MRTLLLSSYSQTKQLPQCDSYFARIFLRSSTFIKNLLEFKTSFTFIMIIAWGACLVPPSIAHPQLMTSVLHRVEITTNPQDIDVTIELTIGDTPALAERKLMDRDHDGVITSKEVASYLDERAEKLLQAVSLSIGGRTVELVFLYEPEIELGVKDASNPSHMVLRLFYFARSPKNCHVGDEIALTDRLWNHAPSVASYHVGSRDGLEMVVERSMSHLAALPGDEMPLKICLRCVAVPVGLSKNSHARLASTSTATAPIAETDLPAARGIPGVWWIAALCAGAAAVFAGRSLLSKRHGVSP